LFEISPNSKRFLRERNGQYFIRGQEIRQVTRKVKQLDDDLPEIASAYRHFVKGHGFED
jgi:hypothetical protein